MARGFTGQGGPPDRPLRYDVKFTVRLSQDAIDTLKEMGEVQGRKSANIARRAIMKDIYIYKAEKKRREERLQ